MLALLTPVGPAIGRTLGDFTGWLTGEPGEPAPKAQQEAFARATQSWEGFPLGTELRRLVEATAPGMKLTLYGFRGAGALCLRLDVAGSGSGRELTCPPLSELEARREPALVVSADLAIGTGKGPTSGPFRFPEPAARVAYGIVADDVDRVEVQRSDGTTSSAVVSGDAFLDVDARPAFSRRVTHIWAVSDGRRVAIAFVPETRMFGLPTTGSPARPARGPTIVERRLHGGTIRWLAHRKPRGTAVPKTVHTYVRRPGVFARMITPDPSAPERMVVSVNQLVCAQLVGGRYQGGGCWPPGRMFSTAPFAYGVSISGQYVTIAGLASDDVVRLTLYLGTGKTVPVPLHDNGYMIEAAQGSYPLRLVGYDTEGQVIGIATFKADGPPTSSRQPAPGATWHRLFGNEIGEVFAVRAAPSGRCWAFRLRHTGASLGCQPPPPPRAMQVGLLQSSEQPTRVLNGRTGTSIAHVVISYEGGHKQTVTPQFGFVLAPLRFTAPVDSIAGLDANGHRIALSAIGNSGIVAGDATLRSITGRWITFGPSATTAAKLRAKGTSPRITSCRRTGASPPLDGYHHGIHVHYLCRGGTLTLIGRSSTSRRWPDRTILGRGRITTLTGSSITVRNELAPNTSGRAALTCSFTRTSPSTAPYKRGQRVELFCAGGTLTAINRDTSGR